MLVSQATLVPDAPGCEICRQEDSTEIVVRLCLGCLPVRFLVWIHYEIRNRVTDRVFLLQTGDNSVRALFLVAYNTAHFDVPLTFC